VASHSQSDVLLSILKQIQAASDVLTEEYDSAPVSVDVKQDAVAEPISNTVVGPTSTELESLNKIINIDHIYFKPAVPVIPDTVNSESEMIVGDTVEIELEDSWEIASVESTEVPATSDMYVISDNFSNNSQDIVNDVTSFSNDSQAFVSDITSFSDDSQDFNDVASFGNDLQDFNDVASVGNDLQDFNDVASFSNDVQDLVNDLPTTNDTTAVSGISDIGLDFDELLFSSFNWEKMSWDLDALASATQTAIESSTTLSETEPPACPPPTPELSLEEPAKLNTVNVITTTDICPPHDYLEYPLVFDEVAHGLDQPIIRQESGYGSELSEAGSPMSYLSPTGSVSSGFDDLWEESLTELFPSLLWS